MKSSAMKTAARQGSRRQSRQARRRSIGRDASEAQPPLDRSGAGQRADRTRARALTDNDRPDFFREPWSPAPATAREYPHSTERAWHESPVAAIRDWSRPGTAVVRPAFHTRPRRTK